MPLNEITTTILDTPFPADTKIRVSVTGLVFSRLDTAASTISFLNHIPEHKVTMTVVKRVKESGAAYPPRHYSISPGTHFSIELDNAVRPTSIKTPGQFPLSDIVNIRTLHGAELEFRTPLPSPPPSHLTVYNCSFYTLAVYPGIYKFVHPGTGWEIPAGDIGLVMSGNIIAGKYGSAGRIVLGDEKETIIDLPGTSDGTDTGEEFVYDIVFNNHCNNRSFCAHLASKEYPGDTDFHFYYDILRQKDEPGRIFHLLELNPRQSGIIVDPFDMKSGCEPAPCVPIIYNPPEPYG